MLDAPAESLKSAHDGAVQLQTKFAASSVLPAPVQCASAGYGQTDLATMVSESREVRVVGRHEGSHLRHSVPSELQIVSVGQRAKVPAGIEVDPVARLRNR